METAPLDILLRAVVDTLFDLAPITILIGIFQFGIVRRPMANPRRILFGLFYVFLGLTLFRIGLEETLIPVGHEMARQLVEAAYATGPATWLDLVPVCAFAVLIGFSATFIEPTLTATATRVHELSGGAVTARTLRIVVSCGLGFGLFLGTVRIVSGLPLPYMLVGLIAILIVLVRAAPREVVPLALDCGGIATSVVTVPLLMGYGIAVAETIPGETTAADGFGLIVLALLLPAILVLAYARLQAVIAARASGGKGDAV